MCNVYSQLARFWDAVEKGAVKEDFRSVCLCLGLCPADVDEALQEELGLSGDELLILICDWSEK